jgi:hypothetical protein
MGVLHLLLKYRSQPQRAGIFLVSFLVSIHNQGAGDMHAMHRWERGKWVQRGHNQIHHDSKKSVVTKPSRMDAAHHIT